MKNQKGITLVALVVTIVVLLILAGITIALVMNPESSIFGNARKAETETNSGSVKELVSTAFAAAETNYFTRDSEIYKDVTDFLDTGTDKKAGTAFAGDFKKEAEKLGLTFKAETAPTITIETNGDATKTFKGFKMGDTTVTYGNKDFTVKIETAAEKPEERITVGEGAAAAE